MASADPTVVLVPVWGVGHFAPMIEAGKRLLARSTRTLTLTVLIMPAPSEKRALEIADLIRDVETESAAVGLAIRFHHLPAADPPAVSTYSGPEEFISLNVQPYVPHVRAAVSGLACPVAAVVVDLFCTPLLDAAHGLGVPAYVYLICSAAMCALLLRSPVLDDEANAAAGDGEFEEMDGGVINVPGLPPVPASCLPSGLVDRKVPTYRWFLYNGRRYTEAAGIIVNTVAELEPRVLAAIADGRCTRGSGNRAAPTVYTVGPVLAATITTPPPPTDVEQQQHEERHECVRWLDAQPPASVLFLCFGSARFFTARQSHEAAHGLDRSGHRFLWVLRGPPEHGTKLSSDGDLAELLPAGFTERTKGRGLVWPKWAPQKEILAHAAVGGFVTHCGWNSVLESLWFGVPMLTWPWAAEQHYNAFTLVAAMGVAVAMEGRRKEDSLVEAAELQRAVRALMGGDEGAAARDKAREMKATCRSAVEEGGSSYTSLQRLCDALHQGAVLPRING